MRRRTATKRRQQECSDGLVDCVAAERTLVDLSSADITCCLIVSEGVCKHRYWTTVLLFGRYGAMR